MGKIFKNCKLFLAIASLNHKCEFDNGLYFQIKLIVTLLFFLILLFLSVALNIPLPLANYIGNLSEIYSRLLSAIPLAVIFIILNPFFLKQEEFTIDDLRVVNWKQIKFFVYFFLFLSMFILVLLIIVIL